MAWIHTYKTSTVCLNTESKRFKGAHLQIAQQKIGVTKPVSEKGILNLTISTKNWLRVIVLAALPEHWSWLLATHG